MIAKGDKFLAVVNGKVWREPNDRDRNHENALAHRGHGRRQGDPVPGPQNTQSNGREILPPRKTALLQEWDDVRGKVNVTAEHVRSRTGRKRHGHYTRPKST